MGKRRFGRRRKKKEKKKEKVKKGKEERERKRKQRKGMRFFFSREICTHCYFVFSKKKFDLMTMTVDDRIAHDHDL